MGPSTIRTNRSLDIWQQLSCESFLMATPVEAPDGIECDGHCGLRLSQVELVFLSSSAIPSMARTGLCIPRKSFSCRSTVISRVKTPAPKHQSAQSIFPILKWSF